MKRSSKGCLIRRSAATGSAAPVVGASPWREFAENAATTAAMASFLGGFDLGRLESSPMDKAQQAGLRQESSDDDEEGGEEIGLVVEDGDSLLGGADLFEPVELTHVGRGVGREMIEE
ncbi:hypothetical protein V8C37DRAFT_365224 [Trichoderma ceciliae]